ncbi:phosphate signaling complex protein PhoU [Lysinibacillus sp. NPDC093692]|uniref:phosphate signaling complex protein PhoU n=1 Tax=Lysinibacillus sp. NPDC093692 TaxID=3390578 RepID=UPI003D06DD5D
MIRESFEKNMLELQNKMGEMVEATVAAMEKAFIALETQDMTLALTVIEEDTFIDALENEMNQMATWLLAKEQPVSRDLRRILSMIKMSAEIERIADFAVNISKSTIKIGKTESLLPLTSLVQMKDISMDMLKKALKSFVEEDIVLAKEVGDLDDRVDEKKHQNYKGLIDSIQQHPEQAEEIVQLLFINRYVERTADHITNMAESTAYFIKGELFDLN